jgi:hypothetical protein
MRQVLLVVLLAAAPSRGAQLRILSDVDGGKPSPEWKYVKLGQRVTLHAELKPPEPSAQIAWFKLEPEVGSVDNTTPSFHFEKIPYRAVEIEACRGNPDCPADINPTLTTATIPDVGTMAFQAQAILPGGRTLATPGVEAIEYGGLSPKVHRVAVRRDDTYLGYVTELLNTVFIFGSAGPDGRNQTDRLIGTDCADMAVYGARRMGKKVDYTNTYNIDQAAPPVATAVSVDAQGVMLDAKGRPIQVGDGQGMVRPGDVLHFPHSRHVAVFYEDREPKGVLDMGDLMLHACWAPPQIQPIRDNTRCTSLPARVLRFR